MRVVARHVPGVSHEKLTVFLHDHYLDYVSVRDAFAGVDTCLFRGARRLYVTSEDVGHAMLRATLERIREGVIENAQIRVLAERAREALA